MKLGGRTVWNQAWGRQRIGKHAAFEGPQEVWNGFGESCTWREEGRPDHNIVDVTFGSLKALK